MEESSESSCKPGGTLVGVSGQWGSKVENKGTERMDRWIWVDTRSKKGMMIRVIYIYRISQSNPNRACETTSYKQQVRRFLRGGDKS